MSFLKSENEIIKSWECNVGKPIVSIVCITYNHEKYIAQAIDSFLVQETDFPFEIIIGDDCSTDNTFLILGEYQKKYPNIIKLIHREKNIGLMPNFLDCMSNVNGEYIALCEGDDYWIDPLKLRQQVLALKTNPNLSFSFHDVNLVNQDGKFIGKHSNGRSNQHWTVGRIKSDEIVGSAMTIPHTTSIVFRSKYFDFKYFDFLGDISAFDYPLTVTLCFNGDAHYIDSVMSEYRQHMASVSSSRSYGYNDKLLNEILSTHDKMNRYYNCYFSKEINKHL